METASESLPVDTYVDAAASGGEMMFAFIIIALVLGVFLVGVFFLFNAPIGEWRVGRRVNHRRDEEQARVHKDLRERIRSYARNRRDALADGSESFEVAARSLQDYSDGVIDSVTSSTRNRRLISSIQALVEEECARLRQAQSGVAGS